MKILSINAGSATVKFQLFEMPEEKVLAQGMFEETVDAYMYGLKTETEQFEKRIRLINDTIVNFLIRDLIEKAIIKSASEIVAIGHRVVHGGSKYLEPVIIDEQVLMDIKNFSALAPLHNPANLNGIEAFRNINPNAKMVAVFDTSFHQTIQPIQHVFPVPYDWYQELGVRKYGFHGISHQYLAAKASEIIGNDKKIIICHLGSGSSISAIMNGRCVDTSMGFTPNSGLIMGTRSGDLDFTIIPYVMQKTGKSFQEILEILNNQSGLLGLSGFSDIRELEKEVIKNDPKAMLAYHKFINAIVAYIAQYYVFLSGIDAIVFSGGIGENSPIIRDDIIKKLNVLDLRIDNDANFGNRLEINHRKSRIQVLVIPTNEELMIAKETYQLVK